MIKFFGGKKDAADQTHPAEAEAGVEETARPGFFSRMKQAVSRTRESLSTKIESIVALTRTVDEKTLEDLEAVLLTSDIGVETTNTILDALRERAKRQAIEGGDELRELLKAQIRAILEAPIANKPNAMPQTDIPSVTFL